MPAQRVVVGAVGDDAAARSHARLLLASGEEVVLVGGGQTPEQLARTAVAEDAVRIDVDPGPDPDVLERVRRACGGLGADDVVVKAVSVPREV